MSHPDKQKIQDAVQAARAEIRQFLGPEPLKAIRDSSPVVIHTRLCNVSWRLSDIENGNQELLRELELAEAQSDRLQKSYAQADHDLYEAKLEVERLENGIWQEHEDTDSIVEPLAGCWISRRPIGPGATDEDWVVVLSDNACLVCRTVHGRRNES